MTYTPEEVDALLARDPASLTPFQRGVLRAIARSNPDVDRRSLARRHLGEAVVQDHPSAAYRRGAARGADHDPEPSRVTFDPRKAAGDNV